MPIYMKIDGIDGDATQEEHKNWMEIEQINWTVARDMKSAAGSAANREASEPSISEVRVTKVSDSSTSKLFQEACGGSAGKTVEIHLVSTGNPGKTYIKYILQNALISNYSVTSKGDRPTENISLNFTKMDVHYVAHDEKNQPKSQQVAAYDLATTRVS